jgi:hypothetical protein
MGPQNLLNNCAYGAGAGSSGPITTTTQNCGKGFVDRRGATIDDTLILIELSELLEPKWFRRKWAPVSSRVMNGCPFINAASVPSCEF